MKIMSTLVIVIFIAATLPSVSLAQVKSSYSLTDLGPVHAASTFSGSGPVLNDVGVVAFGAPGGLAVWADGTYDLLPGSDDSAVALGINNRGDVVGQSDEGEAGAWIGGAWIDIPGMLPDGLRALRATSVNEAGEFLVQTSRNRSFVIHDDRIAEISPGVRRVYAEHINNHGLIVGTLQRNEGTIRAFVATGRHTIALIDGESTATTVNEASRVGGSIDMSHAHLPYVADHGRVTVLDPIPGADLHRVLDVGEDGTVIGLVRTAGFRAAIWRDGEACLLEDLLVGAEGWTLEQASDMNIAGQIAAIGVINGEHRAVLLTPVPMPTPRREQ